ncbi:DUF5659 domain-containing protein [Enterococcus sp. JM9B]|uniref:DUF5659 domain-containing protein n=1 Tax=Enterococcus sp. JM9B TaxID=1857216 RepID=UPI001374BEE9|nr:DUF5659 domain-containing protein [Enterococcus sp. JM9B]
MDWKQKIELKYLEQITRVKKFKYVYDYDLVLYLEKIGIDYISIVYSEKGSALAVYENNSELRKYIRKYDRSIPVIGSDIVTF